MYKWVEFWYKDGSFIAKMFNNDDEIFAYLNEHKDEIHKWNTTDDEPFGP